MYAPNKFEINLRPTSTTLPFPVPESGCVVYFNAKSLEIIKYGFV